MSSIPTLSLSQITTQGIDPALALLPCMLDTLNARVQLLSVALQESGLRDRRQIIWTKDPQTGKQVLKPLGPAKSFWSGEVGGGLVHGVRTHPETKEMAAVLYAKRRVKADDISIWNAIENDDVLAAGLARLLIYTDPYKLPALGDAHGAWSLYMRLWKPGKPKPETWAGFYARALNFVAETAE